MSEARMTSEAQPSNIRRLIRRATTPHAPSTEMGQALVDATRAGLVVEFYDDDPVGPLPLAFRVEFTRGALRVADSQGRPLGTFASGTAAIQHGWALFLVRDEVCSKMTGEAA